MRRKVTAETLDRFMRELSRAVRSPGKIYFTGGATALLLGFRQQTLDLDIKLDPEPAGAFEAIARLKDQLDLNIELACPEDFIPADPGWRERSALIATFGPLEFFHYDFCLQALAKLERGHTQDLEDVAHLMARGLAAPEDLRRIFAIIEPALMRYPAIDAGQFRQRVEDFLKKAAQP